MDAVVGLVLLVAIVWIVRAVLTARDTSRSGGSSTPPSRPLPPPPVDETQRRRQDRADGAFFDGVWFAHYFDPLDRFDRDPDDRSHWDEDAREDGWGDDLDDDVFHDDAGDW